MRLFISLLLLAVIGCAEPREHTDHDDPMPATVMIHNGWVRPVESPALSTAAYFMLHNATESDVTLVAVESEAAGSAELHESRLEEGLMRMRPVDEIHVAAHGHVDLAPGGLHVMLLDVHRPLAAGDTVGVTLHFDDGSTLVETLTVQGEAGDHQHQH